MFYYFITFVISYLVICCYFILLLYYFYLYFYLCLLYFVCFVCFVFAFVFVRATYLRIQGRMQILRFWTEIFKNEVLQRWGGLHSTQNKKCYIEMGLNFWGVLKKCRKRPANFAFRIVVPMSMLTFWKEL